MGWSRLHLNASRPQPGHSDPDQDADDERAERPSRPPLAPIGIDRDRDTTSTRGPVPRVGALIATQSANRAKQGVPNPADQRCQDDGGVQPKREPEQDRRWDHQQQLPKLEAKRGNTMAPQERVVREPTRTSTPAATSGRPSHSPTWASAAATRSAHPGGVAGDLGSADMDRRGSPASKPSPT